MLAYSTPVARRLGWGGLVVVAMFGCSTPQGVGGVASPAEPTPPAERSAVPERNAAQEAPAARKLSANELLASTPSEELVDLDLLRKLCAPAIGRWEGSRVPELDGRTRIGCACCAPFEECPPVPESDLTLMDPLAIFPLRHWHAGSFSAPGHEQVAAVFEGCEPGAANRGGTMLYQRAGQTLVPVAYHSGINPDACVVLSGVPGKDLLVCQATLGMASTYYTDVRVIDFGSEPASVTEVAHLDDDYVCLMNAEPYVMIRIERIQLADKNGDGRVDIVLHVTTQAGTLTQEQLDTCNGYPSFPKGLPAPVQQRLVYLKGNEQWSPTPATRKLLDRLYAARTAYRAQYE